MERGLADVRGKAPLMFLDLVGPPPRSSPFAFVVGVQFDGLRKLALGNFFVEGRV
jgi:hypothetical protein